MKDADRIKAESCTRQGESFRIYQILRPFFRQIMECGDMSLAESVRWDEGDDCSQQRERGGQAVDREIRWGLD
jgi:hypothetical protein